jgi:ligand-binding sensor domain-containing protein/signal transduction histidine kinase
MIDCREKTISLRLALSLALLLVIVGMEARSEQLPVKRYGVADGLAHDEVTAIFRDSHGFLWFSTIGGLSRFDGYRFTTYTQKDGLPFSYINSILESRSRIYWVATNGGGVSRFDPLAHLRDGGGAAAPGRANTLFTTYRTGDEPNANNVNVVYEDGAGNIWAGTDAGLFRLERGDVAGKFQRVKLGLGSRQDESVVVQAIAEDDEGSLWVGTSQGLARLAPDNRVLYYPLDSSQSIDMVWALMKDKDGRIWVGHQSGLLVFIPPPLSSVDDDKNFSARVSKNKKSERGAQPARLSLPLERGDARWYGVADGLAHNNVQAIFQSADGRVWVGTRGGGLSVWDGARFHNYAAAQGLSDRINALAEDGAGNLWVGTQTSGAMKIARSGLLSYGERDGLGTLEVVSIFESLAGELLVVSGKWTINRFDGEKFTAIRPNLPPSILDSSSGRWAMIQDRLGEWWVATNQGLYRFGSVKRLEDLARAKPVAVYTTRDGMTDNYISRLFEDSRGDIWVSTFNPPEMLARWERSTNTFHHYSEKDGLPTLNWANAFAEDRAGNVWIGMHNGGLVRRRPEGRFETYGLEEGVPLGLTQGLHLDREGRLWMSVRGGGTVRIDDPAAERPRAAPVAPEKLSGDNSWCVTEDDWGNAYIGTARGVDRFNSGTGQVKHFTTDDGLVKSEVITSFRDHTGALWFGTREGVSRLVPEPERPEAAPHVLIGGLRIAGVPYPVSELGESELAGVELTSGQNQIEVDFFGLSFYAGESLRYQYMIEGADRYWSRATDQRTVTASLAPGSYRFLVRAVSSSGVTTANPAVFSFTILPPLWRRWWFLALAALGVTSVFYLIYRYRVRRLLELERVRTRIATDLHDDIGASLSQIAILSEVAGQRMGSADSRATAPLTIIADTSREMVDSMSDIVWAINPKRDKLTDLTHRMRRFASDILSARDINFRFRTPPDEKEIKLGADVRRELYLIFKESVNNLAKHSDCTKADLEFRVENDWLVVNINDNGKGFDVESATNGHHEGMGGHGLGSMRKRAESLGGMYEVSSKKGEGTFVTLRVPTGKRRLTIGRRKKTLPT